MEPVGLVASLLTTISTITSVIEYLSAVKKQPDESKGFLHEMLGLVVILDKLRARVHDTDPSAPWAQQVGLLAAKEGPLDQFKSTIDQLKKKLKVDTKVQTFGKVLIWPLSKKEVSELLLKVERLKSTIEIALHHDQL